MNFGEEQIVDNNYKDKSNKQYKYNKNQYLIENDNDHSIHSYVSYNDNQRVDNDSKNNSSYIFNKNDSFLTFKAKESHISQEEIDHSPKLEIEEIEGNLLGGEKLSIDAGGLLNYGRGVKDGLVFFGNKKEKVNNYYNRMEK